ncbi:hypothetical protein GCM10023084_52630 [Streptomyces lacrimifluminis]|uniref:Uncharacterized protein n=1 Tax=Streptomyces lacrimifluminis TaxID=1500077 RepID=A0A917L9L5_9ACTN|nr:hypothetical protein GCM10012282_59750 [Streptomyces lacrimifluminis]
MQVDVQLTVREAAPESVGDVQRQGTLAHTGHAVDHGDGSADGDTRSGVRRWDQDPAQVVGDGGTAGEVDRGRRQLGGTGNPGRYGCRGSSRCRRRNRAR